MSKDPTTRDPRRDPIPGDVLVSRAGRRRTVEEVVRVPHYNGVRRDVIFRIAPYKLDSTFLESWRSWAKGATVVHRGDDPELGPPTMDEGRKA